MPSFVRGRKVTKATSGCVVVAARVHEACRKTYISRLLLVKTMRHAGDKLLAVRDEWVYLRPRWSWLSGVEEGVSARASRWLLSTTELMGIRFSSLLRLGMMKFIHISSDVARFGVASEEFNSVLAGQEGEARVVMDRFAGEFGGGVVGEFCCRSCRERSGWWSRNRL